MYETTDEYEFFCENCDTLKLFKLEGEITQPKPNSLKFDLKCTKCQWRFSYTYERKPQ